MVVTGDSEDVQDGRLDSGVNAGDSVLEDVPAEAVVDGFPVFPEGVFVPLLVQRVSQADVARQRDDQEVDECHQHKGIDPGAEHSESDPAAPDGFQEALKDTGLFIVVRLGWPMDGEQRLRHLKKTVK